MTRQPTIQHGQRLFDDFKWDRTRLQGERKFEKENVKWDEVESDVKGEGNRDVREEFERCF